MNEFDLACLLVSAAGVIVAAIFTYRTWRIVEKLEGGTR